MHFWKDKMMKRMKNMSPEAREWMKAKWGGHHWREMNEEKAE